jgi:glycosyltransferase involved in cell wall biosynthesis
MTQAYAARRLRVAVLVDLPRSALSGGHVKCWERLAAAAAQSDLPLDLTVYFSGPDTTEILAPYVRLRQLPPVFSTQRLKFLPYVPDHTDLSPYHPALAHELVGYDVIHTTQGCFAFSSTAVRVSRKHNIPLITSFHTDTPSYTRIFTTQAIEKICARLPVVGTWLRHKLIQDWRWPDRQAASMERRIGGHVASCRYALVTRAEDHALAADILGEAHVRHLRLGVDKAMFGPHRRDRAMIEREYVIPPGRIVILFVGRVDIGKNAHTLIAAAEKLIAEGLPLHLVIAGLGPLLDEAKQRLKGHVSAPGFVAPDRLARLYASADALALCSEVEIRSMVGVEAMASGCPVLVSEKSGIAELFHHTDAMRVVTGGINDWTEAMRGFAQDAGRREHMRSQALGYGRQHLASWDDVLAEDIYSLWTQAAAHTEEIGASNDQ